MLSLDSMQGGFTPVRQPKALHPRAAGSYQFQRQRAMQGRGAAVAQARRCSWHTLESELDKLERDPVAKVAATLRAMSARGLPSEALHAYAAEVEDVLSASVLADPRPLPELEIAEQVVDGDEDVLQLPVVRHCTPATRRAHADQLVRYVAIARTLIARYEAEGLA